MGISDWSSDVCSSDLPIVGYLDFLQVRFADDAKASKMISAALLSADRGRVLVSRLLSFARRQHLETKVVDLRELVGGMSDLIARSVGADIAMEMETSKEVPLVEIDPNQLELALLNLSRSEERRVRNECGDTCRSRWRRIM